MNNEQGKRAEEIFGVRITQGYLFRARDLGEKWPVSDYYVEINDDDEPYYFIVQVKSSRRGYDTNGDFKISVTKSKINQFSNYAAPTFLAGVNVENELVYLTAITKKKRTGVSKISLDFILNAADKPTSLQNLKRLKREIKRFWKATNTKAIKRNFKSSL